MTSKRVEGILGHSFFAMVEMKRPDPPLFSSGERSMSDLGTLGYEQEKYARQSCDFLSSHCVKGE